MFFLRRLVLICLKHNIIFQAKQVQGVKNKLADSLSRLQLRTFQQLNSVNSANQVVAFKISFSSFKHSYNQHPFSLEIHRQSTWCLVQILTHYCNLPGPQSGPLFLAIDGSPVSRKLFKDQLSLAVHYCGLDPQRYKGHSFRIGAASHGID